MESTFYPGPSKVYAQVADFMQDAYHEGILHINHRSDAFVDLSKKTVQLLKKKLLIPHEYTVLYATSATECWEIMAQSLLQDSSTHIYNGAFGQKWYHYTQKLTGRHSNFHLNYLSFDIQELPSLELLREKAKNSEFLCFTHNETSNGTALPVEFIQKVRQAFPSHILAFDATSSMAGVRLPFDLGDFWYASVQKCFGLPAGLAVLVCSPKVVKRAMEIQENRHYNSLAFMLEKMEDWQTTHTPNVLNIYLLMRVAEMIPSVPEIERRLQERKKIYETFLKNLPGISFLIQNSIVRSTTVLAMQASEDRITELKQKALEQNIILGNGYGAWKNTTFRIANFPSILASEIELLKDFIHANY